MLDNAFMLGFMAGSLIIALLYYIMTCGTNVLVWFMYSRTNNKESSQDIDTTCIPTNKGQPTKGICVKYALNADDNCNMGNILHIRNY